MLLYPADVYEKLEFHKIILLAQKECLGEPGKALLDEVRIEVDKSIIEIELDKTAEWLTSFSVDNPVPLGTYESIEYDIFLLKKEGYVLESEQLLRIRSIISTGYDLFKFFKNYAHQKEYPQLFQHTSDLNIKAEWLIELNKVFDETGEIKPNASPALVKISQSIQNKEKELYKVFKKELAFYQEKGYLVDSLESVRNGRFVLAATTESKRRIPGVIHDESATGKTIFIEPQETVQINNELINLHTERRAEIHRILRDLCKFLSPGSEDILAAFHIIRELDVVRAKAKLAQRTLGVRPAIVGKPTFQFKGAFNPLLLLRLMESDENIVPFDLELHKPNNVLVLSGPNAGGKSVTLKSVGLLQLMVQSGFLPSCSNDSKFGIFTKMFVDIGDQQSIEDDLSTYSSHLKNMKHLTENADRETLFLIDEFGSGTDPKIGGAIAESILKHLTKTNAFGVITTHYSNLKFYAFKTKGVGNGSMEFDRAHLSPTYQLVVGKPGSSFAYEIAGKIGLAESIISDAKHKTGQHEKAIEEMLVELQAERKELENKLTKVLDKEDRLNRLISTYEQLHMELEIRRKKLKIDQKQGALYDTNATSKELNLLIKELRQSKDLEKVEKAAKEVKEKQKTINTTISQLKEEVFVASKVDISTLKEGSFVKMRNSETMGQILSVDKDMAQVQAGFLTLRVPLRELVPISEPISHSTKSINLNNVSSKGSFESKLDIRGYRVEDALWFLQEFLEKAIVNNANELRIIHGVGNGTLKKETLKKLREYKDIKEVWHPEENLGGQGVTMVTL